MTFWKYTFLVYALMEISVGLIMHQLSPGDIDIIHNQESIIHIPAMFYVESSGNAAISMGIISLWAFLKHSIVLRQGCAIAFAIFNALAAYSCRASVQQADIYVIGGYIHLSFTALFLILAIILFRKKSGLTI